MAYANYKDASRANWNTANGLQPNLEQLRFGALQRIAEALETIARSQSDLAIELREARRLRRQVRALRAVITRQKESAK